MPKDIQSLRSVLMLLFLSCLVKSGRMTGNWRQATDLHAQSIQDAARAAMENASYDAVYHFRLINITDARFQVVSGMNYNLTFVMGPTECKKKQQKDHFNVEECPLLECAPPTHCNATVWVQAWMNSTRVTHLSCQEGEQSCSQGD